jgi:hypothetical protein
MNIPLEITKDEAQSIKATIAGLLGDNIYQRQDIPESVSLPPELRSVDGISSAPSRSTSSIGQILTFRNDHAFASLTFSFKPETGVEVGYGGYAGWHKGGSEEQLRTHWDGFQSLLEQFDVFHSNYEFSCCCGFEASVSNNWREISAVRSQHKENHPEDRIPITTLGSMGVEPATPSPTPQANVS